MSTKYEMFINHIMEYQREYEPFIKQIDKTN